MRGRLLAMVIVLGATGVVAGCGGGSSSSSSTPSSSSSDGGSFAAGAEAACTDADHQIAALGTPGQDEAVKYLLQTEAIMDKLNQEVEALDASGDEEGEYADALAKAVPVLTEMSNAARNENFDAVRELSNELVKLHLGEAAEAADLKACAEVPGSSS